MKNPYSFRDALDFCGTLMVRQRLRLDELQLLCGLFKGAASYIEVGVYDGLSAALIGLSTCVEHMVLVDIQCTTRMNHAISLLRNANIIVEVYIKEACEVQLDKQYEWCLIDADHSYEATKRHYEHYKPYTRQLVLHDVEMPGPGQLFKEIGGVKLVSSEDTVTVVDGKVLPQLGYGILFND